MLFHGRVFHVSIGGGVVFQIGWASFLKGGGAPWGDIGFGRGAFEKNHKMGGAPHAPHYGKPCDVMLKKPHT